MFGIPTKFGTLRRGYGMPLSHVSGRRGRLQQREACITTTEFAASRAAIFPLRQPFSHRRSDGLLWKIWMATALSTLGILCTSSSSSSSHACLHFSFFPGDVSITVTYLPSPLPPVLAAENAVHPKRVPFSTLLQYELRTPVSVHCQNIPHSSSFAHHWSNSAAGGIPDIACLFPCRHRHHRLGVARLTRIFTPVVS